MDESLRLAVMECLNNDYFISVEKAEEINGLLVCLPDNFILGLKNGKITYRVDKDIVIRFSNNDFDTYEEVVIEYENDYEIRPRIIGEIKKSSNFVGISDLLVLGMNKDDGVVPILDLLPTPKNGEAESDFSNQLLLLEGE